MSSGAIDFTILINGKEASTSNFQSFVVERDINQPDMCAVVLANQGSFYTAQHKVTDPIEIQIGGKPIYKGEIVGVEPQFKGGGKTTVLFRGMNKLHKLIRKRQSVTYTDKTEKQILQQVLGSSGLSIEWQHEKADSITYKHVYQHNQSDMEFLRTRAGRIGAHVWCVDTKVYVKYPDLQTDSGIKLELNGSGGLGLKNFSPRMNSAPVVNKVTVKGWNPETKELISSTATSSGSKLGSQTASQGAGSFGNEETFTVDHPIWSAQEANALAYGRLMDLSLGYITGEAECMGSADLDLGKVISIDVSDKGGKDPFSGKYYVMGVTHRYSSQLGNKDGFTSVVRLARDAQGQG